MFEPGYYEALGYKSFKNIKDYRKLYDCLTSKSQISMLLGLISNYKFSDGKGVQNVLEIGFYNGVTSMYMLKEGCQSHTNYRQVGIDIATGDFFGKCVNDEATPEERAKCDLYTGKTVLDIEEMVSNGEAFDLVFIDGGHCHPNPLINLVAIIPYIHTESLVCLHDVIDYMRPNAWGESFIYESWKGKKYRNRNIFRKDLPQEVLGIIEIPRDKNKLYENLLDIAKLPFRAAPWKTSENYAAITHQDLNRLERFMLRHYPSVFVEEFIAYLNKNLEAYEEEWVFRAQETRFYNYLYTQIRELKNKVDSMESQNKISNNLTRILLKNTDKKILFWGASLFLKEYLKQNDLSNLNIVGIIDEAANDDTMPIEGLKLYPPKEIQNIGADIIIPTVKNSHEKVYKQIKEYITKNNVNIKQATDIFE